MMLEVTMSLVALVYCVAGVVYSVRLEADTNLMRAYGYSDKPEWSDTCFLLGFLWPVCPIFNKLVRRKL